MQLAHCTAPMIIVPEKCTILAPLYLGAKQSVKLLLLHVTDSWPYPMTT